MIILNFIVCNRMVFFIHFNVKKQLIIKCIIPKNLI